VETTIPHQAERKYILGVDDEELRRGIMDGTIPSTIVDSGATSGVGTEDDPSHRTGELSNKRFTLPSSVTMQATEIAEYPFEVRAPAKSPQLDARVPPSPQDGVFREENESIDSDDDFQFNVPENAPLRPIKKEKSIFIKVLDME